MILKVRYKVRYDSVRKQGSLIILSSWLLLVILSIYFFLVKRNFAKKGVMVVIGA